MLLASLSKNQCGYTASCRAMYTVVLVTLIVESNLDWSEKVHNNWNTINIMTVDLYTCMRKDHFAYNSSLIIIIIQSILKTSTPITCTVHCTCKVHALICKA